MAIVNKLEKKCTSVAKIKGGKQYYCLVTAIKKILKYPKKSAEYPFSKK